MQFVPKRWKTLQHSTRFTRKPKFYIKQSYYLGLWLVCTANRLYIVNAKNKGVPLSLEGAKGERNYSSYSFLTLTLDGSEWSVSRPGRALLQGKIWTQRLEEKSIASSGDRTPVLQSLDRQYTDQPISAPTLNTI
jgi:hypothetical protein